MSNKAKIGILMMVAGVAGVIIAFQLHGDHRLVTGFFGVLGVVVGLSVLANSRATRH